MDSDMALRLMDYELGDLDYEETLELFTELIATGLAWRLQGHYGRRAMEFIDSGEIDAPATD